MGWFGKNPVNTSSAPDRPLGEGVFRKCDSCGKLFSQEILAQNFEVCPECGHHMMLPASRWIELLADPDSFEERDTRLRSADPLQFVDTKPYHQRLRQAQDKGGHGDAFRSGLARIHGVPVQLGLFVFRFMGGSMGSVVGEKIARLFERGLQRREPVIILSASGGARMQEGLYSLMQMAKTVSALERYQAAKQPFVSVLLHPTTGGVAASYAFLGDVNIAEPGALIGFAGPRVIENTIRKTLPKGFQRAEYLLEHGMVDMIVPRERMKDVLHEVVSHLGHRSH